MGECAGGWASIMLSCQGAGNSRGDAGRPSRHNQPIKRNPPLRLLLSAGSSCRSSHAEVWMFEIFTSLPSRLSWAGKGIVTMQSQAHIRYVYTKAGASHLGGIIVMMAWTLPRTCRLTLTHKGRTIALSSRYQPPLVGIVCCFRFPAETRS